MNFQDYQAAARRTQNEELNNVEKVNHAVFGLASEAGEISGIFQMQYQGHSIAREALVKELGDLLWFIAELCDCATIPLEEVAKTNIEKLKVRYPVKFSAERSLHRKPGDI